MQKAKDYYKVLGVEKRASDDEIKRVYRELARKYHPDSNPDNKEAESRFKEISEAYSVLGDNQKRKEYDQEAASPFAGGFSSGAATGFGDIFSSLFTGGARGGRRVRVPQRGQDLETQVKLTFKQSVSGIPLDVKVPTATTCDLCNGSGVSAGATPGVCPRCSGRGKTQKVKRYRVNIPAGVRDGSRVRVAGKGEPGSAGGPPGDLFVITQVEPSAVFHWDGERFEVEVPLTVAEAIAGAVVEVPTLSGFKRLKVAAGTQDGSVTRLRGEGPPFVTGKGRRDIYYRFRVKIAEPLTKQQQAAVAALAEAFPEDPRKALLAAVKEDQVDVK